MLRKPAQHRVLSRVRIRRYHQQNQSSRSTYYSNRFATPGGHPGLQGSRASKFQKLRLRSSNSLKLAKMRPKSTPNDAKIDPKCPPGASWAPGGSWRLLGPSWGPSWLLWASPGPPGRLPEGPGEPPGGSLNCFLRRPAPGP